MRRSDKFLFGLTVLLFLFSDVYYAGLGRVYDYVYISLVAISLRRILKGLSRFAINESVALIIIACPWLVVGMFQGSVLLVLAWLVGIILFYGIIGGYLRSKIEYFLAWLGYGLWVSLSVFFVQFCLKFFGSIYLDLHEIIGSIPSRGWNDEINYFRASGLFQEPNAFAAISFAMASVRIHHLQRLEFVDVLSILSIIVSQSLWGFGAVIVLLGICRITAARIKRGSILIGIVLTLVLINFNIIDSWYQDSTTGQRISGIDGDASRNVRFGYFEDYLNFDQKIFGVGLNGDKFQILIGANGFAFLYTSFGVAGVVLLFFWLTVNARFNWRPIIAVLYLFTTFPHTAYMFFWVWLSLIMAPSFSKEGIDRQEQCKL